MLLVCVWDCLCAAVADCFLVQAGWFGFCCYLDMFVRPVSRLLRAGFAW